VRGGDNTGRRAGFVEDDRNERPTANRLASLPGKLGDPNKRVGTSVKPTKALLSARRCVKSESWGEKGGKGGAAYVPYTALARCFTKEKKVGS